MPVNEAVVIASIAGFLGFAVNLWSVRRDLLWGEVWPLFLSSMPALLLGVYFLRSLDDRLLRVCLGVTVLAGCAVTLWATKGARIHRVKPWGYVAGLLGGLSGGTVGASGPPIVLYCLLRGWDKSVAKGVMSVFFMLIGIWRVVLLFATGVATGEVARKGVLLLVPALVGAYLGTHIFRRMSNQVFRYAALVVLVGLSARLLFVA